MWNRLKKPYASRPFGPPSPAGRGPVGVQREDGRLAAVRSSRTTSESSPWASFSSWKPFCHQRKMRRSPHLTPWTSAKVNAPGGGGRRLQRRTRRPPCLLPVCASLKTEPGGGKCGRGVNVPAPRKSTFPSLPIGRRTWRGQDR